MSKKITFFLSFVLCYVSISVAQSAKLDTLMCQGISLYSKGNYITAIDFFSKSVQLARQQNNITVLSNAYNNLANSFSQVGKTTDALYNYQLALTTVEKQDNKRRIAEITKNIGALYSEQKEFDLSMSFYKKAYTISRQINDTLLIADCLNNQGVVYEQQQKYKSALDVYLEALLFYRMLNNKQRISMTLNNLAIVYKYLKNYPLSIKYYEDAIKLSEDLGDKFMTSVNLNNLGNVYALNGEYKKSLNYCFDAMQMAKEISAEEVLIETYDGISIAYEKLDQYIDAIKYRKLYEEEKNSFISAERSRLLTEMQTKYETEKKESQIKLLEQSNYIKSFEIKEQNTQLRNKNISIVIGLVLFILLGFVVYFFVQKQKLKNQIANELAVKQTEEKERLRIAKDIHDDLGSGLSKINFLSELIIRNSEQSIETKENVNSISETAKDLVDNMRDLIWALNPKNMTLENLLVRIREYSNDYLEDFPAELKFNFPEIISQKEILNDSHREIFMTLKECLNNIVKHSKATIIEIETTIQNDFLSICIKDNGVGFLNDSVTKGNGLRNMKNRIDTIGGKFLIESFDINGTLIKMTVELNKILRS